MSRRDFAERIGSTRAVIEAFAMVPREAFLPPPPWLGGSTPMRYAEIDDVYQDIVIAIDPVRQLNNGQPSAHAKWLAACDIVPGEVVLHLGCGLGYYTAILAELAGPRGHVVGLDVDPALAARAAENLAPWPQAIAQHGDGSTLDETFDVLYINAGVTHVRRAWLDALRPGGRIVLPLTAHVPEYPGHGVGTTIRIERVAGDRWPVRAVTYVGMYDCTGARDSALEPAVAQLMKRGFADVVLDRRLHERGEGCLVHHDDGCFQHV